MARGSSFQEEARSAADRIEAARETAAQLDLLAPLDKADAGETGGAVATRGKGRAQSVLRDWLALRGMRMPEDVLADLAGLSSGEDAFLTAMARAEQLVAWQFDGAVRVMPSGTEVPANPTASARMEAFKVVFASMLRAADALAPYGLAKVTPDQTNITQTTNIVVAGGGSDRAGEGARVVSSRRTAPPPMPWEMVEHQDVSGDGDA